MNAIKIEKLTKTYGKARGITELSLTVEQGESFGFIGPNGAGKSTTIRTILGFIKPSSGSALVLGKDIVRDSVEIRRCVGYLPSEPIFYRRMKVKDILRLSSNLHNTDCKAESESLCERLGLDVRRKVDELSFGNRKKVGIVCALQHKPELLILDEPTSGLDPLVQLEFFKIIQERRDAGSTIFLSSHILSEIEHNCTRAAVIRDGSIIACDKVEALSEKNAKRVTLHYGDTTDILHTLSSMDGVQDYSMADSLTQRFLYGGDITELLKQLTNVCVKDMTIAEPELEEVFIHFYK